jgi:hypothetical protein
MAVRAKELNLPAAIGVGEEMFEKYLKSPKKLDPRRITAVNKEIANLKKCELLVQNKVPFNPINMGPSVNS